VVGDRPKHDDDAFSPQWEINFRIVGHPEGRIAISHAGVVDPLLFEADINALLAE